MLKIFPPVWFFLFLTTALLIHFFIPSARVFNFSHILAFKILGAMVFIGGMLLSLQASKQFKENNTEILPASPTNKVLVTNGAYRFTRNPMYLGMVLSLLGIAAFIGTLPVFLAAFSQFLVLNFVFIPFEEAKLTRIFGQQYINFKQSTRRWL